ncbi:unnamed protein product [Ambrosiozyma monospora]|uniref:Unnamed protein product n=1 Tax=Ambrosiozyma monospora TaxID=43982 RepID=A0ACB5TRX9_AMBMO|nr:unnamed protein product [Ambrosiozyma monospora]
MLNAHLALNSGNKVALYTANSYTQGAQLVYPLPKHSIEQQQQQSNNSTKKSYQFKHIESHGMSRQFKLLDEAILSQLDSVMKEMPLHLSELKDQEKIKGTLTGAISMALAYINRLQQSISNLSKARILVISLSDDPTIPYISIMNAIFAAQKMKIPIDTLKLNQDSTFLQQASDSTNGIYIKLSSLSGLLQYLCTTLFIDPMLRGTVVVLPTTSNVDFRASCFMTNKVVDIGYVCSVCLCILSIVPSDEKCPTCGSKFDHSLIVKLKKRAKVLPLVNKKKRKLTNSNGSSNASTPSPQH